MEAKVVLDTSILIDFIRNRDGAVSLVKRLSEKYDICTTDINVFELYYGAYLSKETSKNMAAVKGIINTILVFSTSPESVEISAKILAELDRKGQKIEIKDILVAGICMVNSCIVATHNKQHFERMGVKLIE
ncbi:MAG: type II toxin-antitoxin system VapC family toxin [Candidatus Aenigmarchaeota archaeon]|nr:type II toxin-antitoxin system VapC family toxin [Candidatus Aenigmarchaeota archaeon]